MTGHKWLEKMLSIGALLCLLGTAAAQERGLSCRCDNCHSDLPASHCEIKQQTLRAAGGALRVDGGESGGISVRGEDRGDILLRARIRTDARGEAEARQLASQIRIATGGGQIRAEGPAPNSDRRWTVSFELSVPRRSSLSLQTHNGGISISDVRGQIEFSSQNGGVSLKGIGGGVRGQTTNGGLSVELSGTHWIGEGLDVRTTNGGIVMLIPSDYSAQLETGTVNGVLRIEPPFDPQKPHGKLLSLALGSGGTLLRATTTNASVIIKRK